MTSHLGPREDGQSEHGPQALVVLPTSCGKMKMLPPSTSKTLAAGHFLLVSGEADTAWCQAPGWAWDYNLMT